MIKKRAVLLVTGMLLVVFQSGLAVSAWADSTPPSLQEIDQQALSLLKAKKYEELDAKLKAFFAGYEADFLQEKYLNTAFEAFSRPRPDLEPLLTEWIAGQTKSYAPYLARGIYYSNVGAAKRGMRVVSKTTEKQFEDMEFYFEKAMKDIDKALSINKRLINGLCYKMWILSHHSKEKDQMRRVRDTALALNPYNSAVRFVYISRVRPRWGGSIEEMAKEIEDARPYFEKYPGLKPIEGRILAETGDQALFANENAKAIGFYTEALRSGNYALYNFQRGCAYSFNNQFDLCIKDMDIAIEMRPNYAEAYFRRGYAKHRLQKHNEGIAELSKSIEDNPYDDRVWITRAGVYAFLGRMDLALADCEKAVALSPNNQEYLRYRDKVKNQLEKENRGL